MPGLDPGIHDFLSMVPKTWMAGSSPAMTEVLSRAPVRCQPHSLLIPEIRLDGTVHLDGQRIAVAILGVARGDTDPALADAVFLDIGLVDALEANADVARQNVRIVIGARRIDRQAVRQHLGGWLVLLVLVHSSASISCFRLSGLVVGACRATTWPARSTRNFVKFHLMDGPSRPDFSA